MSQAFSKGCSTDERAEKHRQFAHRLQRVNYVAGELLIVLRNSSRETRQFHLVRAEIEMNAWWMNFFLKECEQSSVQGAELRPDLITLKTRVICSDCREKLRSASHDDVSLNTEQVGVQNSVWRAQVAALIAFIDRVAADLFEEGCGLCDTEVPSFLIKLRNAVLRQKRYLASVGAQECKFAMEPLSDSCAGCGQPVWNSQDNETRSGNLSA